MAVMTTVLFPLMMYATPSGLTLYIMASTAAGIVDSTIVKRHIKRQEEDGTLFPPPNPNSEPSTPAATEMANATKVKLSGVMPAERRD